MKSYDGKVNTNFYESKIPKEGIHCVCFTITLIDSVFKLDKHYYPEIYLEECKYVVKEKKMSKFIGRDKEFFLGESDYEVSDENVFDKEVFN